MNHHLSGKPPLDRHEIFMRKFMQKGIHPTMQMDKPYNYGKARAYGRYMQKMMPYQEHMHRGMKHATLYKKK